MKFITRSMVEHVARIGGLSVCLSVCTHISRTTRQNFTKFSAHVARVCGSFLFWRRCNMLNTSGFVDGVMFLCNGPTTACRYRVP